MNSGEKVMNLIVHGPSSLVEEIAIKQVNIELHITTHLDEENNSLL